MTSTNSINDSMTDSMTDSLNRLPVDLFIQQITYLPYDKVVEICQLNRKFHNYCTSYPIQWKALIQNTFGSLIPSGVYSEILKEIHQDLGEETYNYLVYTQFTKYLDPTTQLLIYDQQKDKVNFDKLFAKADTISKLMYWYRKGDYESSHSGNDNMTKISALWLIGNNEFSKFVKTLDDRDDKVFARRFLRVMNGNAKQADLDGIATHFVEVGNLKGLKRIVKLGANINNVSVYSIQETGSYEYLDVLKYVLKHRNFSLEEREELLSWLGDLDSVKYLVELGVGQNTLDNAFRVIENPEIKKYLKSKGAR